MPNDGKDLRDALKVLRKPDDDEFSEEEYEYEEYYEEETANENNQSNIEKIDMTPQFVHQELTNFLEGQYKNSKVIKSRDLEGNPEIIVKDSFGVDTFSFELKKDTFRFYPVSSTSIHTEIYSPINTDFGKLTENNMEKVFAKTQKNIDEYRSYRIINSGKQQLPENN